ncbi:MAG TPA: glycosyltransferase [Acidimicrobiales bacterium]|nr:glycosyltransferase [Acidimicrobiales bacterium]
MLLAPAAWQFTSFAGSESGWVYDIVTGMLENDPELHFTCIAESVDSLVVDRMEQHAVGTRRTVEVGGAVLPLRIAATTRRMKILDRVDLVHHGLPFALDRTYSVIARQAARRQLPFVVGPIQTPLTFMGSDEKEGQIMLPQRTLAQAGSRSIARVASPLASRLFSRLSSATLHSAQRVVAIDERTRESLIARGVVPERILVIPPPLRVSENKRRFSGSDGEIVRVVTVGYLIERKAVDQVISAVARLAASGFSVALDVVGDGPELPTLRRLVGQLPGGESVRFHGWLERHALQQVLSSAHVYVTMSRAESWGQAVVEAMAQGLVVVSAANDGARSLIALGAPVRLVGIGATGELDVTLRDWCGQTPALIRSSGAAGIDWVNSTVTAPVVARRWCEAYNQAVEENTRVLYRSKGEHKHNEKGGIDNV